MENKKPLSAFQYYMKAWATLPEEDQKIFKDKATADKKRYVDAKEALKNIEIEKIKKLGIFLTRSHSRVPCVGLDRGWTKYETTGPVTSVVRYTDEEKKDGNIKAEVVFKSVSIGEAKWHHNTKTYFSAGYTMGKGNYKKRGRSDYVYHIEEGTEADNWTEYTDCYGKSWSEEG